MTNQANPKEPPEGEGPGAAIVKEGHYSVITGVAVLRRMVRRAVDDMVEAMKVADYEREAHSRQQAALRGLVESWSDPNRTIGNGEYFSGKEAGRIGCADELAALLDPPQEIP
jgi:hypothetical protein